MSNPPIRIAHPDPGAAADACGCCEGTALSTARPTPNRPNLTAIAFRAGDHGSFKATMLTGLASSAHPALADLRTREDDDFSIALIDAWATVCDVLGFYQERLANEAYMGTATEPLSVAELARLTGYRLHPGAAAETDLVLLMEDPPGAAPDVADLTVPAGTRVQSQPGPDESPQVFETLAPLAARVAWNVLRPRQSEPAIPGNADSSAWVAGTPNLQVGDAIVFIGRERHDSAHPAHDTESPRFAFRRITALEPAGDASRTRIAWDGDLGSIAPAGQAPTAGLRLFHLRDRAALFGYNAPHPLSLSSAQRNAYGYASAPRPNSPSTIGGSPGAPEDWLFTFASIPNRVIHLDNIYKGFAPGSWMVLERPLGLDQVYRIQTARDDTIAAYGISGKAMRLSLDTDRRLNTFQATYRGMTVYGGSIEIALTDAPLTRWIGGAMIEIDTRADDLPQGRLLMFRGKRARLEVAAQSLTLTHEDGAVRALLLGDRVTLLDEPAAEAGGFRFAIADATGFAGTVLAPLAAFRPVSAPPDAETIAVAAVLDRVVAVDAAHSRLELTRPLGAAFDRDSLAIHANVARAAHGEGVAEILGHGDPSQPFQKAALKQGPVTHRLAATETGVASTLTLRIDGVAWQEVPDLYRRGADARVFRTVLTDDGRTVIEFGDGISGARPPAGRDNILAEHSRGLGAAGNLQAGQLKLLLDRPLGLKEADNPLPASGGADPETMAEARRNAPIHTLTLGRLVSLSDYRDFALGFPGIAKAEARWVWQGDSRRVVVTVAGEDGARVLPGSAGFDNLLAAFRRLGDPLVAVELLSHQPAHFRLGLRVATDPAHDRDAVLAATEAHLRGAFGFGPADFGAMPSLSGVAAAAHQVPGLRAVDIDLFYRTTPPQANAGTLHPRLISLPGRRGPGGALLPAEILTLDPGPLDKLEAMP